MQLGLPRRQVPREHRHPGAHLRQDRQAAAAAQGGTQPGYSCRGNVEQFSMYLFSTGWRCGTRRTAGAGQSPARAHPVTPPGKIHNTHTHFYIYIYFGWVFFFLNTPASLLTRSRHRRLAGSAPGRAGARRCCTPRGCAQAGAGSAARLRSAPPAPPGPDAAAAACTARQ